ncbi:MAG: hypothetical protein ACO3IN_11750 [Steroidobacteraceae bacterium]
MFPQLNVYLDDSMTAQVIDTTSVDFWTYEDLVAKVPNGKTSEHGMRLTVAFLHCEGRDPRNLEEVKMWGREHKVKVTLGEAPNPTQSEPTGG